MPGEKTKKDAMPLWEQLLWALAGLVSIMGWMTLALPTMIAANLTAMGVTGVLAATVMGMGIVAAPAIVLMGVFTWLMRRYHRHDWPLLWSMLRAGRVGAFLAPFVFLALAATLPWTGPLLLALAVAVTVALMVLQVPFHYLFLNRRITHTKPGLWQNVLLFLGADSNIKPAVSTPKPTVHAVPYCPKDPLADFPLHQAVRDGDRTKIEQLLSQGADVTQRMTGGIKEYTCGATVLHVAVQHGQVGTLKLLVEEESVRKIIDDMDAMNATPFSLAYNRLQENGQDKDEYAKRYQIVILLIQAGASKQIAQDKGCNSEAILRWFDLQGACNQGPAAYKAYLLGQKKVLSPGVYQGILRVAFTFAQQTEEVVKALLEAKEALGITDAMIPQWVLRVAANKGHDPKLHGSSGAAGSAPAPSSPKAPK